MYRKGQSNAGDVDYGGFCNQLVGDQGGGNEKKRTCLTYKKVKKWGGGSFVCGEGGGDGYANLGNTAANGNGGRSNREIEKNNGAGANQKTSYGLGGGG